VTPSTLRVLLAGVLGAGAAFALWLGADMPPLAGLRAGAIMLCHIVVPAMAAVLCVLPGRRASIRSDRLGWLLLGGSAATWSAASVVFGWHQLSGDPPPYPSIADGMYIAYAVPALAGLFMFAWSVPHVVSRLHTVMDGVVIAAGLLTVGWHLLLTDLLRAPGEHGAAWLVTFGYLACDITVASVVLSLAWRLVRARLSLGLVGAGLLLVAVCDVFYVRAGILGTLVVGESFWQAGYTVGFLLLSLAAVSFVATRRDSDAASPSEMGHWSDVGSQGLVYAILALAVVVTVTAPPGWSEDSGLVWLGVATLCLALLREVLVMMDTASLRIHLERKVWLRTRDLDASNARLRAVTQTASDGIVVIDGTGDVRAWNAGAEALFGCAAEDAIGRSLTEFLPERFRDAHRAGLAGRRADPATSRVLKAEVFALHRDGSEVPVELTVTGWEHHDEQFFTGILRDISERRLAEGLRERERGHMRLVQLVAVAANQSVDIDEAAATALRLVADSLGWRVGHAMLVVDDDADHPLRDAAWHTPSDDYAILVTASNGAALSRQVGVVRMVHTTGEAVWTHTTDERLHPLRRQAAAALGLDWVLALPIRSQDRIVGVLEFFSAGDSRPQPDEIRLLEVVGSQLGRAVERDHAQRRLARLAWQDALTGLANRLVFNERLELYVAQGTREQRTVGVVLIDLDGFKEVNDTLGHAAGDELLKEVGKRLLSASRSSDTVARLGGDEFAIALSNAPGTGDVAGQVARLLDALDEPMLLGGHQVRPRGSIGVALSGPGDTADTLLRNADLAMYDAKSSGKGRVSFFHPRMYAAQTARRDLATALDHALEAGEVRVLYQPVVSLRTGQVVGRQAATRWPHPEHGLLDPDELLRDAGADDLTNRLAVFLLRRACADAATWRAEGETDVMLSVRLPLGSIGRAVVDGLRGALVDSGLPAKVVQLEVSEHVITETSNRYETTFTALRELEVGICVEGLGTGRTSLSRLRDLAVRQLLVGSHLVGHVPSDPTACALVEAVVSMGLALDVDVVAGGVERLEQLAYLRARGCTALQGPLLGEPARLEERARGRVDLATPARLGRASTRENDDPPA
jgi:diguanylate cyclase (GGDEF)-like protein/PAS domain S-box-containing protein